jgi:predicted phage tail component-like protein
MTLAITFGDTNISKWLDGILLVTRNVGQNRVPQLDQVGKSDGKMLSYIRADEGTIVVTAIVRTNVNEKRRLLADALTTSTPTKLIFADEPDIYYNAISTGQITLDEAYLHNTLTITFTVPDGIAHSVATQTADNMPYKNYPVNQLHNTGFGWKNSNDWNPSIWTPDGTITNQDGIITSANTSKSVIQHTVSQSESSWITSGMTVTISVYVQGQGSVSSGYFNGSDWEEDNQAQQVDSDDYVQLSFTRVINAAHLDDGSPIFSINAFCPSSTIQIKLLKVELGSTVSPWSPNPADPEYYADTITVHNGGTYPVEPVITATMHADNGFLGFANSQGGVLQFGNPEEIDGYTSEESEVALNLAAVQGSHMDNQAATNNPYWGGDPSMPNEQIGNAIWTQDSYDGWKVEPNWPSITGTHLYWNGPSIKHDLVQTHNGDFKGNLTWDVMTRFQTGVAQVGALETTLESDGKPIFQMILKDNSALSDQIWWMCYYKGQLVVNEQLDRSIFTNDKFIQLELQKFGNSVVFRVSPWVGNQGRETTITRQFTFADAADVETKQFSTWFMRDKTWGESTMYLIASTVKWQNVSWYTNIKNRFSNGDVLKIDVANAKTYLNGSLDPTMHTLGNQWEQFKLPPGDTKIAITPSSWAQPFACEVEIREAWL